MRKILQTVERIPNLPRNVVSHLMKLFEEQTHMLERVVAEKTEVLAEEKRKADDLLAEMLPRYGWMPVMLLSIVNKVHCSGIITKLRNKEVIEPETFDNVTILFSDLPAFAGLVSRCTPLQVIALLNATHSAFDDALGKYSVYKVETISDCYMVSSVHS